MSANRKLEDRGWQQMNSVLDKEMPEKKRRAIFWWIGIPMLILLGMYFMTIVVVDETEDLSNEIEPIQKKTIASLSTVKNIGSQTPSDINTRQKNDSEIDEKTLIKKNITENNNTKHKTGINDSKVLKELKNRQTKNDPLTQRQSVQKNLEKETAQVSVQLSNTKYLYPTVSKNIRSQTTNDNSPILDVESDTVYEQDLKNDNSTEKINTDQKKTAINVQEIILPFAPLVVPKIEVLTKVNASMKMPLAPTVKKWNFYALLNGGTELKVNRNINYGIGAGARMEMGKWALFADASYSRQNFEGPAFSAIAVEVTPNVQNNVGEEFIGFQTIEDDNGNVVAVFNIETGQNVSINRLDEIEGRLGVRYAFAKDFYGSSYFSVHKPVLIRNNEVNYNASQEVYQSNVNSFNISSELLDGRFPSLYYGFGFGLYYDISSRFGLGVDYSFSLNRNLNDTDVTDRYFATPDGDLQNSRFSVLNKKMIGARAYYNF